MEDGLVGVVVLPAVVTEVGSMDVGEIDMMASNVNKFNPAFAGNMKVGVSVCFNFYILYIKVGAVYY